METMISDWLDAAIEATDELATTTLGYEGTNVTKRQEDVSPEEASGSYIALIGEETSLQVGFASDPTGVKTLSGALLGMEGDEVDELSEEDILDALGEIANILAGGVKNRMAERDPSMKLGLPMIVQGKVRGSEGMQVAIADITVGAIEAQLLILRENK